MRTVRRLQRPRRSDLTLVTDVPQVLGVPLTDKDLCQPCAIGVGQGIAVVLERVIR